MSNSFASLQFSLDIAKPAFIRMMKDLNPKAGRWIQYQGHELENDKVYFLFKSSQNSLSFKVCGGLMITESYIPYDEVYQYFKELKQPYIEY